MSAYQPILELDPSHKKLVEIFNSSNEDDWTYDAESKMFALKSQSAINVRPDEEGSYSLMYCYDEVMKLSESQMRNLPKLI
jgi:hypothetical protein